MIKSLKDNKYGILLMLLSSVLVCFGQYFWKISSTNYWYLVLGFGLYGIGALVMLIAYKFGSLSVLQPILCLNYVFAIIIGYFLLQEQITPFDIVGISIIFVGVFLIAISDHSTKEKDDKEEV